MTTVFEIPAGALANPARPQLLHADHERVVDCHLCGWAVLVCGYVDDLPDLYRCLTCRKEKP